MKRILLPFIALGTMGHMCGRPFLDVVETDPVPMEPGRYVADVALTLKPPEHRFLKITPQTRLSSMHEVSIKVEEGLVLVCDGVERSVGDRFACGWRDTCEVACELHLTRMGEEPTPETFRLYLVAPSNEGEYDGVLATLTLSAWRKVQP